MQENSESSPAGRIPVEILGATGAVGQRFIQRLHGHPWFEVKTLRASSASAGKRYADAAKWFLPGDIPDEYADMIIEEAAPSASGRIAFSGLDASVAGGIEEEFAHAGYAVVSNARNHRMDSDVPLLIPEVNPEHLDIIRSQRHQMGCIITNPNCSTIGLAMALKPLHDRFGVSRVSVTTLQAASGAGYPGVPSLDLIDNVVPYIGGEEEKMETETKKILGTQKDGRIHDASMRVSAQCNRVPVTDGHLERVEVELQRRATLDDVRDAFETFVSPIADLNLPSAPKKPIHLFDDPRFPQPRLHRDLENGMAVSVGRLQGSQVLDYKFAVLSHNTIRGAAGTAILNAELLIRSKILETLLRDIR